MSRWCVILTCMIPSFFNSLWVQFCEKTRMLEEPVFWFVAGVVACRAWCCDCLLSPRSAQSLRWTKLPALFAEQQADPCNVFACYSFVGCWSSVWNTLKTFLCLMTYILVWFKEVIGAYCASSPFLSTESEWPIPLSKLFWLTL